jgi:uncharacterized phage protein gp47/JayE
LPQLIDRAVADINSRIAGADALMRRSTLRVLAMVSALGVHGLYGHQAYIARQILVDTADNEHLARHASMHRASRLTGTVATGPVACTGSNGASIDAGSKMLRGDGVEYTVAGTVVIAGGVATVTVNSSEVAADANAAAGVALSFVSPAPGVDPTATVDTGGLIGGSDVETDDSLRARTLALRRKPPRGGHESDYVHWALEVAGTTRAWALGSYPGIGQVTVSYVQDDDPVSIAPDAGELAAMLAYLTGHVDPESGQTVGRNATVELLVVAPTLSPLAYTVHVEPDTADIRASVEAELDDLHLREAEPGGTLYLSRIREAVSSAAGEFNSIVTQPASDAWSVPGVLKTRGTVTFV